MPGLQGLDREEHQRYPGFHIEDARAAEPVVIDLAGHGRKRSQGVDRVEMAEKQDWLGVCGSGEIDLEVVAEIFRAMQLRAATDDGEPLRDKSAHAIGGGFIVAGRFDFDKFPDGLEECVLAGFEVKKTVSRSARCLFAWHELSGLNMGCTTSRVLSETWERGPRAQVVQYNLQAVSREL